MPKRIQKYETNQIAVTFDPNLCIHSEVCLNTLPRVFDVKRKRWIALEEASPEQAADAIGKCPSGALQYHLKDEADG